jgi:DNA-binding transcriptional ArsR family regulator
MMSPEHESTTAAVSTHDVDPEALSGAAEQASDFLKSLANPVRLRILCLLVQGEATVGDITEKLGARQSLISQHLALLRKDGMVRPRRDGQTIYYALADKRAERLIEVLYETFCAARSAELPETAEETDT